MTPPPPGGPRDWSPAGYDGPTRTQVRPGQRPIRGGGHIEGLVWARLLAWCGIAFGATSLAFAILMPISGDPARLVWVAGFGAVGVWFALMAAPRYRATRGRSPVTVGIGVGLGIAAMAVAAYAFLVVVAANQGTRLPAPAHWVEGGTTTTSEFQLESRPEEAAPAAELDAPEAERLALAQGAGTAAYVLKQITAPDSVWPAALAVSTDGATLLAPDGSTLAPLAPGTQVLYSTSSDQLEFSLTLMGPHGAVATYESTSGVVESSVP